MDTVFLLIVVFLVPTKGIPDMQYIEVTGSELTCQKVAKDALKPIVALVGEHNLVSVACTKKFPQADDPRKYRY